MAYYGFIPLMRSFIQNVQEPNVLEIGVDKGVTFFSLFHFLTITKKSFLLDGVDVRLDENVKNMLNNFVTIEETQKGVFTLENSLVFLEKNKEKKYDLALVDGDHNYFTVSKELEFLHSLTNETAMIICDDYYGRWSTRDLFYSTRDTHSNILGATPLVETEKQGVKAAVDEFIEKYPEWKMNEYRLGEPVILTRGNIVFK